MQFEFSEEEQIIWFMIDGGVVKIFLWQFEKKKETKRKEKKYPTQNRRNPGSGKVGVGGRYILLLLLKTAATQNK